MPKRKMSLKILKTGLASKIFLGHPITEGRFLKSGFKSCE